MYICNKKMSLLLFTFSGFGLTTIITKGDIFQPLRDKLDNGSDELSKNFFGLLISCPMCVGFWVGVVLSLFVYSPILTTFINEKSFIEYSFLTFLKKILCLLMDGGLISGISWIAHMKLNEIREKIYLHQTENMYLIEKMSKMEENLLNKSTEKEILTD